jgi:hypothetical protein
MTLNDLRTLFDEKGHSTAFYAIDQSDWPYATKEEFFNELERLQEEKLRRWTHPSRYPAAFDRHEF